MTKTLMTYGDSNTYGAPPIAVRGDHARYGADTRWPGVALAHLGAGWKLVEEGLPGRTTQFEDPVMGAHMNGQIGLKIALLSHGPLDVLTIMLGTNDLKTRFAPTPNLITAGIAGLLDIALSDEMQARHGGFQVLLICPPPIFELGAISDHFVGGRAVSQDLPEAFETLATARGVGFLNAGDIVASSQKDGIHWDASSHSAFGAAVATKLAAMMDG